MELIDRITKDIDDRLEELRPQIEEIPRLEAALAALDATSGATGTGRRSGRAAPAGRGRTRGGGAAGTTRRGGAPRKRARRGQRREELLQLVAGDPQITIAEAARTMGVSSPQVSVLVRRLEEEGVLRRSDGRFLLVDPAASATTSADDGRASEAEPGGPQASDPAASWPQEIQGPGVKSIAGEEGVAAAESVPEPARDQAGRPPAS
jgi:hypothetical protein